MCRVSQKFAYSIWCIATKFSSVTDLEEGEFSLVDCHTRLESYVWRDCWTVVDIMCCSECFSSCGLIIKCYCRWLVNWRVATTRTHVDATRITSFYSVDQHGHGIFSFHSIIHISFVDFIVSATFYCFTQCLFSFICLSLSEIIKKLLTNFT